MVCVFNSHIVLVLTDLSEVRRLVRVCIRARMCVCVCEHAYDEMLHRAILNEWCNYVLDVIKVLLPSSYVKCHKYGVDRF